MLTIAAQWTRLGCIGFGGPPTHIALLRQLCVDRRGWLTPAEFEDGIAATNLLPGPASTQLAIFCAWRLRGIVGALVGGTCFIVPGLLLILALSALVLGSHPSVWVRGAAAGAGCAVPAVAVRACLDLIPASWARAHRPGQRPRWLGYLVLGAASALSLGQWLVLTLVGCGIVECLWRRPRAATGDRRSPGVVMPIAAPAAGMAGVAALAWVALKVGALSYGGGFVIIPLMRFDAVDHYHWMTAEQFLGAVALGQVTPGPVVLTVAVVGYAVAGVSGALLATLIAFAPSFAFVLLGGAHFERLRTTASVQAFLDGAGPAAIGAIAGSAIALGLVLNHLWQVAVLALAVLWLVASRRGVLGALLGAGALGIAAAAAGLPLPS